MKPAFYKNIFFLFFSITLLLNNYGLFPQVSDKKINKKIIFGSAVTFAFICFVFCLIYKNNQKKKKEDLCNTFEEKNTEKEDNNKIDIIENNVKNNDSAIVENKDNSSGLVVEDSEEIIPTQNITARLERSKANFNTKINVRLEKLNSIADQVGIKLDGNPTVSVENGSILLVEDKKEDDDSKKKFEVFKETLRIKKIIPEEEDGDKKNKKLMNEDSNTKEEDTFKKRKEEGIDTLLSNFTENTQHIIESHSGVEDREELLKNMIPIIQKIESLSKTENLNEDFFRLHTMIYFLQISCRDKHAKIKLICILLQSVLSQKNYIEFLLSTLSTNPENYPGRIAIKLYMFEYNLKNNPLLFFQVLDDKKNTFLHEILQSSQMLESCATIQESFEYFFKNLVINLQLHNKKISEITNDNNETILFNLLRNSKFYYPTDSIAISVFKYALGAGIDVHAINKDKKQTIFDLVKEIPSHSVQIDTFWELFKMPPYCDETLPKYAPSQNKDTRNWWNNIIDKKIQENDFYLSYDTMNDLFPHLKNVYSNIVSKLQSYKMREFDAGDYQNNIQCFWLLTTAKTCIQQKINPNFKCKIQEYSSGFRPGKSQIVKFDNSEEDV